MPFENFFAGILDIVKNNSGLCISFHLVFWGLLAVSRASVLAAFSFVGLFVPQPN